MLMTADAAAGTRRLLLTHFWPGNDRERSRSEAGEAFGAGVLIADEGLEVSLCRQAGRVLVSRVTLSSPS